MALEDADERHLDALQKDLDYRRKKQWDIFSWASTILLSLVGGVFALATTGHQPRLLWQRGAVSFAALTVAVFAQVWIHYHWQYELDLAKTIGNAIGFPLFRKRPLIGYPQVLAALTLAALLAVWCPL
jgi:hypothetical protein